MRTNIVIDDDLVSEAFKYAKVKTKRELVDLALKEFVAIHKRRNLMEIFGKGDIRDDYNHKKLRTQGTP
jgi:Arc/MetJ family transcription regulator